MSIPLNIDSVQLFGMLNSMEGETFGQRLKRLRLAAGLSQRKLAFEVGLTNGAISQAENGHLWIGQLPSLDILRRLARALGITLDELVGPDEADQRGVAERPAASISDTALLLQIGAEPVAEDEAGGFIEDFAASARHGRDNLIPQNYDDMRRRERGKRRARPEPTIFRLRVSGNCMARTVADGDIVWFDTTLPREPIALVLAVRDEHEAHIKRLVERDGVPWLESDDGWAAPVDEHWRLLARAFTLQRRLL